MKIKSSPESVWCAMLVGLCLMVGFPFYFSRIPDWTQPSFVGLIWGGQFILGVWLGGANHHTFLRLLIATTSFLWCAVGFQWVTDFSFRETLLFSALILSAGFIIIRCDQRVVQAHWPDHRTRKSMQVSLIDLFVATTVTAVLVSGLRNLTAPPALLIGVGWSLLVGCCCCWMTYHWAWNDLRPVGLPLFTTAVLVCVGCIWLRVISPSLGFGELCQWLVCGPASVLASQCCTVLVALALARQFPPTDTMSLSKKCDLS